MLRINGDFNKLKVRLSKLIAAGRNITPLTRRLAEDLADDIKQNFESESSPSGTPWAPLSPVTLRERAKKGYTGPKGKRTGRMARVTTEHDNRGAAAGLTVSYAKTFHYGAKQGQYGTTGRGTPIPWGTVPARPVAGFNRRLNRQLGITASQYLRQSLR